MVAPSSPNGRPRSAPRNSCWISPVTCGLTMPGGGALDQPGGDQPGRASWASPASALVSGEQRQPEDERVAPAAGVAEPAGGHQHQPEGQRVPGEDPLQVARGWRRAPRSIDGTATLTMLTSSSVMNAATRPTPSACQRRSRPVRRRPVRRPVRAHRAPRRPSITHRRSLPGSSTVQEVSGGHAIWRAHHRGPKSSPAIGESSRCSRPFSVSRCSGACSSLLGQPGLLGDQVRVRHLPRASSAVTAWYTRSSTSDSCTCCMTFLLA